MIYHLSDDAKRAQKRLFASFVPASESAAHYGRRTSEEIQREQQHWNSKLLNFKLRVTLWPGFD